MENELHTNKQSFIYHVELLIEDYDHKTALGQLLHKLNLASFQDYRIQSGVQLGEEINSRKSKLAVQTAVPVAKPEAAQADVDAAHCWNELHTHLNSNKLVRLIVNKGFGIKLNIPCRIIQADKQGNLVTVYHVDEKQVYTFGITEIEEIIP